MHRASSIVGEVKGQGQGRAKGQIHLTLKRYDRFFFPKLPLRVTQQKGNKDIKSLNAHNSVTIGPTELADPSLESSFHALSDGQCVVSG